jgi:hypothetical protein
MFEMIGYAVVRAVGYGWLWGKNDPQLKEDVFGNGSHLLEIGFIFSVVCIAGAVILCRLHGSGR